MKSPSLVTGLVLAAGLQTALAAGHHHGVQHLRHGQGPALKEYATTTTTTTSVVDITCTIVTSTITVTSTVAPTSMTTQVAAESTTLSLPPSSGAESDAGSVAPATIADAHDHSTISISTSTSVTSIQLQASSATSSSPTKPSNTPPLTPNGIKAGSAGGDAYPFWKDHIGWWYDWTPNPLKSYPSNNAGPGAAIPVVMLWGDGTVSHGDEVRYQGFLNLTTTPAYILGYEEPDCSPPDSADISSGKAARVWDKVIAPWSAKGSLLGSPSMCKQSDEDWLTPFEKDITTPWDFTAVHINTIDMDVVNKVLDHYWDNYDHKPIWVTEFACVDTSNGFTPSENQTQINQFIADIVDLLQNDDRVYAYAYSSGAGLGDTWPPVKDGELTESGQAYLDAIKKYA